MSPPPPGLVGKTSLLQQLDYLGEITIFLTVTFHKISMDISRYLVLGTGNLFATKWVHIKHYGLKIGVPNFW